MKKNNIIFRTFAVITITAVMASFSACEKDIPQPEEPVCEDCALWTPEVIEFLEDIEGMWYIHEVYIIKPGETDWYYLEYGEFSMHDILFLDRDFVLYEPQYSYHGYAQHYYEGKRSNAGDWIFTYHPETSTFNNGIKVNLSSDTLVIESWRGIYDTKQVYIR